MENDEVRGRKIGEKVNPSTGNLGKKVCGSRACADLWGRPRRVSAPQVGLPTVQVLQKCVGAPAASVMVRVARRDETAGQNSEW